MLHAAFRLAVQQMHALSYCMDPRLGSVNFRMLPCELLQLVMGRVTHLPPLKAHKHRGILCCLNTLACNFLDIDGPHDMECRWRQEG